MAALLLFAASPASRLFFAIIVSVFLYKLYNILTDPLGRLPGNFLSRFTSLPLKIAILRGNRTAYVHSLHLQYGSYVRISPNEVSIADVDAAKTVYKIGTRFLKGSWYTKFSDMVDMPSIFSTSDSKVHGFRRKLAARGFSDSWVSNMEPCIVSNVDLAIKRMTQEMIEYGHCDVLKWFTFMATDVVGEASFGESFRTLETGEKTQYIRDLEREAQRGILRTVSPWLAFLRSHLPWAGWKEEKGSSERLLTYADESLDRYWNNLRANPHVVKPTLLTKSYEAMEKGSVTRSELRLDAVVYIGAGTDTTALAATQAVWYLSQHPDIEKDLIRAVSALPDHFNDTDLQTIKLLQYVINETLRLKPSVSEALPRIVPQNGATLGGYFIPEGKTVGIPNYTLHRDPGIWEQPGIFNPSRWHEPTKDMLAAFLPFGGGSRVCIGSHFAQLELRHALARFYRSFPTGLRKSSAEGFRDDDMATVSYFLLFPRGKRCLLERRT